MQQENVRDDFEESFLKWIPLIVLYCKNTQVKNTTLKVVISGYSDDASTGKHR